VADLYDDISDLVDAKLKQVNSSGKAVNLTEWVSQVTESLADMIVFGTPEELQHKMMLFAFERLEHFVLENQRMLAEEETAKKGLH
jgi:hypothetical protein